MAANDRRIILVILSLYLTSAALGQNAPAVRWGRQLITDTDDVARNAVAGSDGGIYFTIKKTYKDASGNTTSKGRFLLKYSRQGEQLWSRQLDPGVEDTTGLTPDDNIHSLYDIIEKQKGLYRINQYKPRAKTNL